MSRADCIESQASKPSIMDTGLPASGAEWVALGERHLAARRVVEAAACYERAVQLEPNAWNYRARLGRLYMATRRFDAAELELRHACTLKPDLPDLFTPLAYVLREQNKAEAAIAVLERALAIDPAHMHAAIAEALMLPPIYSDSEDLRRWRERFASGLARLRARIKPLLSNPQSVLDLDWTNFLLAYQGENDLALQKGYSGLVAALLGVAVPQLQAPLLRTREHGGRIRVGFISSDFRASTVGGYFLRWIADLPRDRFHVSAFHTGALVDEGTLAFQRGSDSFAHVTGRVDDVARTVRDSDLDIAVLLDVGMSAKSVLLANLRLARRQCAAWGHPVTTGSEFTGYFISCSSMEPPDAQSHYSEALVCLPGIGVCYRPPEAHARTRAQIGLPADRRIYLSPQSLCKIHPDNDALFIDLVERDHEALIVFFEGQATGQTLAFAARLERCLRRRSVPPRQQFKFLPRMSRGDFLGVMKICDVMIDTLHWSGGNTTLDALAAGLPVVTLEGRLMRGRQTAAMLRILGIEELIAGDQQQYVTLALRVGNDNAYRAELSARIGGGLSKVFDRAEPVAALARAFEEIARE
jgi:CRISPR-associated protein Csy1